MAIVRLDFPEEASQAFEKLITFVPKDIFIIYQIANLYYKHNELKLATKWFNVVANCLPIHPGILSPMGRMFSK